jgi:3-oxoadipate enol-lactonase/4-carboxymuconolactone decarboxylase
MERWFAPASREENRPGFQFMQEAFARFHPDSFAWAAEAVRRVDLAAQLSQIEQPTLVVASEHDPGVTPQRSRQLAESISNAELVWTPHAHHLASLEHPGFVGDAMATFLHKQRQRSG